MEVPVVDLIAEEFRQAMLDYAPKLMSRELRELVQQQIALKHGYRIVHRGQSTDGESFVQIRRIR